ncbi:MAG: hypothetical protein ACHQ5A_08865 [Opitutales bacterium]
MNLLKDLKPGRFHLTQRGLKSCLPPKWIVVALALVIPLSFALYTNHGWEDYFITLRCSRNLVEGNGLVFYPGERVHAFTSPFGVLVPAIFTLLVGPDHEQGGLWLFRLFNTAALAGAVGLLWERTETLRFGPMGRLCLFGLILADAKLIDFSINGMETAMLVFFLLLLWCELEAPGGGRPWSIGVAIAGLLWTRPDAFILSGSLILARLFIRDEAGDKRKAPWRTIGRGALIGGGLYAPWFCWAWWYYGTPVPHTILAKAGTMAHVHFSDLLRVPLHILSGWSAPTGEGRLLDIFLPSYWWLGDWPAWMPGLANALLIAAAFGWLIPALPAAGRRASLAFMFGMFYLGSIFIYPWYAPPWSVLATIPLAAMFDWVYRKAMTAGKESWARAVRLACLSLVAAQVFQLGCVAWQARIQQTNIEDGLRHEIGDWLHRSASPGDAIFLESLGYIGYYSRLKTYDVPGLSSPEVVALIHRGGAGYAGIIAKLHPRWVVLRTNDLLDPAFARQPIILSYEIVARWNRLPELDRIAFLPGRSWLQGDSQFLLFRRRQPATATP